MQSIENSERKERRSALAASVAAPRARAVPAPSPRTPGRQRGLPAPLTTPPEATRPPRPGARSLTVWRGAAPSPRQHLHEGACSAALFEKKKKIHF